MGIKIIFEMTKILLTRHFSDVIIIMVRVTKKEAVPMHVELRSDQMYVTVDLMIVSVIDGGLRVLLSRRVNPPYEGLWALPGRFVGLDESAGSTARRLLDEMLPLPDVYLEQLYTFAEANRDPRGRVISVAYLAIVPEARLAGALNAPDNRLRPFRADTQSRELRLAGEDGRYLEHGDLAFDHEKIIRMGITRLQGKIDYTEIAFRFLDDSGSFSLGEVQTVFEAILGRSLDTSNFRRSLLGRYEKTGRMIQTNRTERSGRGRPSGLYCLKE